MILVQTEITVEQVAMAIEQMAEHQINELAVALADYDIGRAVKLNSALDLAIVAA